MIDLLKLWKKSYSIVIIIIFPFYSSAHLPADKVKVIPDPIKSEDITTQGDWSNFNLTWPRSTEVTHGMVFFKVFVEVGRENKHFVSPCQALLLIINQDRKQEVILLSHSRLVCEMSSLHKEVGTNRLRVCEVCIREPLGGDRGKH